MELDPSKRLRYFPVRVPINTTLSDPINLRGWAPKAILTPAALTSTTFQFQAGLDVPPVQSGHEENVVYKTVLDDAGAAITVTVSADRYILLPQSKQVQFLGLAFVKLLMGSTEAAERNFFLVCGVALQ